MSTEVHRGLRGVAVPVDGGTLRLTPGTTSVEVTYPDVAAGVAVSIAKSNDGGVTYADITKDVFGRDLPYAAGTKSVVTEVLCAAGNGNTILRLSASVPDPGLAYCVEKR